MNLAGKILTFLILFLSIAFLVLAVMVGATHQEWKKIALDNKEQLAQASNILDTYKGKSEEIKKKLNSERVARRLQLAQLESQLNAAEKAFDEKEALLREEIVTSQRAQDNLNKAEQRLKEQDIAVAELREKNKSLIDDISTQRQSVVNLTNQVYKLAGDLEQIEITRMDLAEQLALREKVMAAVGVSATQLTDHIEPEVDGVVLRTQNKFIAISLGGDDGVRAGHKFDIYRGDRFIGKAEITTAEDNIAIAKLIPEFLQAPVAEGDHVTTKF